LYEQQLLLMKRKKAPKYYDYDLSLVMKVTSTQILNLTLVSNIQIQHVRYLVNDISKQHTNSTCQVSGKYSGKKLGTEWYPRRYFSLDFFGSLMNTQIS
jgi:hypothetical protein